MNEPTGVTTPIKDAYRHTKIVFTRGPASQDDAMLEQFIRAGVDVCRLNMAHADHAWTRTMIRRVREVCARVGRHIAILMDVKGPEIRTEDLPAPVELAAGQLIDVLPQPGAAVDDVLAVSVNYPAAIVVRTQKSCSRHRENRRPVGHRETRRDHSRV